MRKLPVLKAKLEAKSFLANRVYHRVTIDASEHDGAFSMFAYGLLGGQCGRVHRTVEASRRASALAIGVFSIISNFLLTTFPISRLISRRRLRHPCHGSQYFAKVPVPMQLEVPVTRYLPHRAIIWNHFASDGTSRHGGTGTGATENFGPKCKYDNSAGHQTLIAAKATPDHKGTLSSCLIRNNSRANTAVAWISSPAWIASPLLIPPPSLLEDNTPGSPLRSA